MSFASSSTLPSEWSVFGSPQLLGTNCVPCCDNKTSIEDSDTDFFPTTKVVTLVMCVAFLKGLWSWEDLPGGRDCNMWPRGGSSSMRPGLRQSSVTRSWGSYSGRRAQVRARTSCQRPGLFWSCLTRVLMPPSFWVVEGPDIFWGLQNHCRSWLQPWN